MTDDDATAAVLDAIAEVAPEVDPRGLDPDAPLQDQVDMDSMDLLAFLEAVAARTGVDVPEADYRELATIASAARYVARRAG